MYVRDWVPLPAPQPAPEQALQALQEPEQFTVSAIHSWPWSYQVASPPPPLPPPPQLIDLTAEKICVAPMFEQLPDIGVFVYLFPVG